MVRSLMAFLRTLLGVVKMKTLFHQLPRRLAILHIQGMYRCYMRYRVSHSKVSDIEQARNKRDNAVSDCIKLIEATRD